MNPNSKLEVIDGYVELDISAGTPSANDCDAADEVGRMKVDIAILREDKILISLLS